MSDKQAVAVIQTDRKVEEAVKWLARQKELMESELTLRAKEIGDYLIRKFFDDDLAQVSSQNPLKNMSFHKLCERTDLPFSESALRRFLHVAVNFRVLPSEKAKELPPSHHDVLYQVADAGERCRIGCVAVDEGLSVRRLREMVKGKGRRRPGAGRKRLSEFKKNWRQVVQAVERLAGELESEAFSDVENRHELRRESRKVRDQLNKIIDQLLEI
jgi:hypothetical protein